MKKLFGVLAIILVVVSWAFAANDLFSKIEKNKDGKISKQEYMDAAAGDFAGLDKNKDGFLTKGELKAIDTIVMDKFLKEADTNKDGKISREEFTKYAEKRFKFLDKNNDGFIDQKEWNEMKDGANPRNSKVAPISPLMIFSF
jgi:Ca2+-binding EF-hand superfamily protein